MAIPLLTQQYELAKKLHTWIAGATSIQSRDSHLGQYAENLYYALSLPPVDMPTSANPPMITTVYETQEEYDQAIDQLLAQDGAGPNCRIYPLLRAIVEMAPGVAPSKMGITNDAFLAACLRHAKEKVVVDFDSLAKELAMSKGGASNKFRAIMKAMEQDSAPGPKVATTKKTDASPKAKETKRKASPTTSDAESDDDTKQAPKKPKATTKKGMAKPVKKEPGKKKAAASKPIAPTVESDGEADLNSDDDLAEPASAAGATDAELDDASAADED